MYSPIFGIKKNARAYGLVWLSVGILQAIFFIFILGINWQVAIIDSLVFNFIFGLSGRVIWPVTKFSRIDKVYYFNSIVTHLAASTILITVWYFLSSSAVIFGAWMVGNVGHDQFISDTRTLRIVQGYFFYLLLIMNYYLFIIGEDQKENELREVNLVTNLRQAELEMLKSQLNPHFIFNSLNSISSLTIVDPENAQRMVILLSDFLRYSLQSSNELVSFEEELNATQKFLDIEKIRFDDKLVVEKHIEEGLEEWKIPSLILQPLVENALKHGLHEALESSKIKLICKRDNELLHIEVQNSYDPKAVLRKGAGVGLKNVKARLQLIYDLNDLLVTQKNEDTFIATLRIPR